MLVYAVEFAEAAAAKSFPSSSPFGLAYRFSLTEAVEDCEEYLVHLPTLERLAATVGLELIYAKNFTDFFAAECAENQPLLERMKVLPESGEPISDAEWEVAHTYLAAAFRRRAQTTATSSRGGRARRSRTRSSAAPSRACSSGTGTRTCRPGC